MATNAAMVLAKDAKSKPRDLAEAIAARLRADPTDREGRCRRSRLHQSHAEGRSAWTDALRTVLREGEAFGRCRAKRQARRRSMSNMSRPIRPGPMHVGHCRGAVFGDALASLLRFRRPRRHARILHQRCRRPGRRARALGVPALSRGARRGHRRDPGGTVSRRLSEAGRAGARRRAWRQAARHERGAMAADRARQGDRHDDGRDQGRSRRAQHQARRVLLGAFADRGRQQQGRRDHRFPARQGRRL